jgi:hypothetical protein
MTSLSGPGPERILAVGLVYRPSGTPGADRSWARALVVRHARAEGLTLLDVFELSDDEPRNAAVLRRLADFAAHARATVIVVEGLDTANGARLADDLGLRLERVPPAGERRPGW